MTYAKLSGPHFTNTTEDSTTRSIGIMATYHDAKTILKNVGMSLGNETGLAKVKPQDAASRPVPVKCLRLLGKSEKPTGLCGPGIIT